MLVEYCNLSNVLRLITMRNSDINSRLEPYEEYESPQKVYKVFSEHVSEQCMALSLSAEEIETMLLPLLSGLSDHHALVIYLALDDDLSVSVKERLNLIKPLVHYCYTTLQQKPCNKQIMCFVGFAKPQFDAIYGIDYSIRMLAQMQNAKEWR